MTCKAKDMQAGAIGFKIRVPLLGLPADFPEPATVTLRFRLKNTTFDRLAALEGSWDAQVVYYITVEGDFDLHGVWEVQPILEMSSGGRFPGKVVKFEVLESL